MSSTNMWNLWIVLMGLALPGVAAGDSTPAPAEKPAPVDETEASMDYFQLKARYEELSRLLPQKRDQEISELQKKLEALQLRIQRYERDRPSPSSNTPRSAIAPDLSASDVETAEVEGETHRTAKSMELADLKASIEGFKLRVDFPETRGSDRQLKAEGWIYAPCKSLIEVKPRHYPNNDEASFLFVEKRGKVSIGTRNAHMTFSDCQKTVGELLRQKAEKIDANWAGTDVCSEFHGQISACVKLSSLDGTSMKLDRRKGKYSHVGIAVIDWGAIDDKDSSIIPSFESYPELPEIVTARELRNKRRAEQKALDTVRARALMRVVERCDDPAKAQQAFRELEKLFLAYDGNLKDAYGLNDLYFDRQKTSLAMRELRSLISDLRTDRKATLGDLRNKISRIKDFMAKYQSDSELHQRLQDELFGQFESLADHLVNTRSRTKRGSDDMGERLDIADDLYQYLANSNKTEMQEVRLDRLATKIEQERINARIDAGDLSVADQINTQMVEMQEACDPNILNLGIIRFQGMSNSGAQECMRLRANASANLQQSMKRVTMAYMKEARVNPYIMQDAMQQYPWMGPMMMQIQQERQMAMMRFPQQNPMMPASHSMATMMNHPWARQNPQMAQQMMMQNQNPMRMTLQQNYFSPWMNYGPAQIGVHPTAYMNQPVNFQAQAGAGIQMNPGAGFVYQNPQYSPWANNGFSPAMARQPASPLNIPPMMP